MWETFKHIFGFCGEGHITIWHLLGSISSFLVLLLGYFTVLKNKLIQKFESLKKMFNFGTRNRKNTSK